MSVEIFLKIDGVDGSSRDRTHKGWVEIISCDWALSRVRVGRDKPAVYRTTGNELSLVKAVGADSVEMMALCASGRTTPGVQISIVPATGKRELKARFVTLTLEDVAITSMAVSGRLEDNVVCETVALRFRRIGFEYCVPVSADSSAINRDVDSPSFDYDFVTQSP